jgi:hypothetical protein
LKLSTFLEKEKFDIKDAKIISRLIDIYPNVYEEYLHDLSRPASGKPCDIICLLELFDSLAEFIENPKVLNSLIKLNEQMRAHGESSEHLSKISEQDIVIAAVLDRLAT